MTDTLKKNVDVGEEYRKVAQAVRDFIFENHKFPQVNDIATITGIQKQLCNEVIGQLVSQKQLYVAFEGKGLPKIVLPYDMMQSLLMTQKKPDWLSKYGFSEKTDISRKIEELQKDAIKYDQFERLLYTTSIPLEEATAYTLSWLGFQNVRHHKDDQDNPDVTFEYRGVKALLEVEGTKKAGSKDKIAQLSTWIQRELATGMEASKLKGFFVVNHYKDLDPADRKDPLTNTAKQFLMYYRFGYFTTTFLFEKVRQVMKNELSKEKAQEFLWQGEEIE